MSHSFYPSTGKKLQWNWGRTNFDFEWKLFGIRHRNSNLVLKFKFDSRIRQSFWKIEPKIRRSNSELNFESRTSNFEKLKFGWVCPSLNETVINSNHTRILPLVRTGVSNSCSLIGGPNSKEKMLRGPQFIRKKLLRAAIYKKSPQNKLNLIKIN